MIYVLQVGSGREHDVVMSLVMNEIKAYAPIREQLERRHGEWHTVRRLIFPGYVFAETALTDEIYHKLRNTGGVLRILGRPTPLYISEEKRLRPIFEAGVIGINRGHVRNGVLTITEGLLKGREAEIVSFSIRQKRCRMVCMINGRRHSFTVSTEIEKL